MKWKCEVGSASAGGSSRGGRERAAPADPALDTGGMGNCAICLVPMLIGAMATDPSFTDQPAELQASADLVAVGLSKLLAVEGHQ